MAFIKGLRVRLNIPRCEVGFFCFMKRLLIVRIPYTVPPERAIEIEEQVRAKIDNEFTILVFSDKVDKTEVEIVYDPHLSQERTEFIGGEGSLTWRQK